MITSAAILAGGKGTRLGSLTHSVPKPMLSIGGKPLLERHVESLKKYGVRRIIMLVCQFADVIEQHFGDGRDFGVEISYVREDTPLGTGGALAPLRDILTEDFFLLFGDVAFEMKLDDLAHFHQSTNATATLVVHPTDHPHDSDLVRVDRNGVVLELLLKPHAGVPACNLGNAGMYCLSPDIFPHIEATFSDLMKDVLPPAMAEGATIMAYRTPEYIKDMGTPDRIKKVNAHFLSGRSLRMCREKARPAVFFDRDGTLVQYVPLLHRAADLSLIEQAPDALRRLNQSEYLSILATNQPVVARNLCTMDELHSIHDHMEGLLGKESGWLDMLYSCPHHPDAGYPEENPDYKIPCTCRKPGTGMIDAAIRDLNIDRKNSWMVGDSRRDIMTGKNAGLTTILVRTGMAGTDTGFDVEPDYIADDVGEAVNIILEARP